MSGQNSIFRPEMDVGRVGIGLARDDLDDTLETLASEQIAPGRVGLGLVDSDLSDVADTVEDS